MSVKSASVSTEILGYEGAWRDEIGVSWGSAVLKLNGNLVNGGTGSICAFEESVLKDFLDLGAVVLLSTRIPLDRKDIVGPIEVFDISLASPLSRVVKVPPRGQSGVLASQETGGHLVVVIGGSEESDRFRSRATQEVLVQLFSSSPARRFPNGFDEAARDRLLRQALVLEASDPILNAVKVKWATEDRQPALTRVALTLMRSEEDKALFLKTLEDIEKTF